MQAVLPCWSRDDFKLVDMDYGSPSHASRLARKGKRRSPTSLWKEEPQLRSYNPSQDCK